MALNIKNPEVERLAIEIAAKTGESRTEAVRRALLERKARLELQIVRPDRLGEIRSFLEREICLDERVDNVLHGADLVHAADLGAQADISTSR